MDGDQRKRQRPRFRFHPRRGYTEEDLEALVQSLARAGFKNVRLDLTNVPRCRLISTARFDMIS